MTQTHHRPAPTVINATAVLRKLVEMAGGAAEQGYILALSGEGLDGVPDSFPTAKGTFTVHRPQTELALRRLVWKAGGAPFVALIPRELAVRLPPDLIRRARGHKVLALSLSEILGLVLGVQVAGVDDDKVQRLALQHIEAIDHTLRQRTLPTVVNRELLDELVLEVTVGARVREASSAELLAGWLERPIEWDEAVTDLVVRNLPALKGAEGRILAWALQPYAGGGVTRLRAVLVRGILLSVESDEVAQGIWGPLWEARTSREIGLVDTELRGRLSRLAAETLDVLGAKAQPFLDDAEKLARELMKPAELEKNPLLPLGLASRCATVAAQAAAGQIVHASDVAWIEQHRAASSKRSEIAVLVEMARLSRFCGRSGGPIQGADLSEWIDDYAREGAFADLVASRLMRALAATAEFHHEANAVLVRYRSLRNAANGEFARRLAAGYAKMLNSEAACPLHRLWQWRVLPDAESGARFYVIVMDGCSYPLFLELLDGLSQNPSWPIGLGATSGDPGLALLPSVTSHSRGALFLGEIPKDALIAETVWRDEVERERDPGRFSQNKTLGSRTRKLFLKGDLADGGRALVESLEDQGCDVVAAVFNAVDDQIGSKNTGAVVTIAPEQIHGFIPSLKAALKSGRRVLITSDHGHSPYLGTALKVEGKGPARFAELGPNEPVPEGFVEIDVGELGGSPGRKAFAWEMGRYRGLPHVAFHGGCSLEELVVPMAWLVEGGSMATEPGWWFAESTRAPAPSSKKGAARKPTQSPTPAPSQAQFELFGPGSASARAARIGIVGLSEPLVAALDVDERAALVLLAQNGSARASELGNALGRATGRMAGFMTKLKRKLHDVGVVRFRIEQASDGEPRFVYEPPVGGGA